MKPEGDPKSTQAIKDTLENATGEEGGKEVDVRKGEDSQEPETNAVPIEEGEEEEKIITSSSSNALDTITWYPEDWGIFSQWNIPILVKPKKKSTASNNPSTTNLNASTTIAMTSSLESTTNMQNYTMSHKPLSLFLRIETMVTLPQLTSDTQEIDFGQLAIGTRQLKSFKLFNHSVNEDLVLRSVGFNAMGPFTLLRPIKRIPPRESRIVIVECLPKLPGLNIEVLHIYQAKTRYLSKNNNTDQEDSEDEKVLDTSGHRLQVTCRVQGLMPSISLHQLLPPPTHWNPRSGILDFGQILASETPTLRKFTIKNHSTFTIQANIQRCLNAQLPLITDKYNYYEKTLTGLPVISVRPEQISIGANESEEIEVIFRPDHMRVMPYREEFDIIVGETDEILRLGVIGRVWHRQYQALPDLSSDELLFNNSFATGTFGAIDDGLSYSLYDNVRLLSLQAKKSLSLSPCVLPEIVLQFPNPFDAHAKPDSYTLLDPNAAAVPVVGKGGKAPPPVTTAVTPTSTASWARRQLKRLRLFGAKSSNPVRESTTPGTFELLLSTPAKRSGLFSLSVEKGVLTNTKDEVVEIQCTQPPPRELGGVPVGSWKTFDLVLVLKGGWFPANETDEQRVAVKLMAFVSV